MSFTLRRPRYAEVVSTLALLVAMGGTTYAATALPRDSVGAQQIRDKAVRSPEIKDGQVKAADLAPNSVGSTQLVDGSVGLKELAGADVTGPVLLNITNGCGPVNLAVPGLKPGEAAFISFEGSVAPNLVLGPIQVVATDQASVQVCNLGLTPFNGTVTVRVVSFG
jgi:hypothetical protein